MSSCRSKRLWRTCVVAAVVCGCAVSEPLDLTDAASRGTGGQAVVGPVGGASGNAPASGAGGTAGSGGTSAAGGSAQPGASGGRGGNGASGGRAGAGGAAGGNAGAGGGRSLTGGAAGGGGTGGKIGGSDASTAPTFTEIYKTILTVYCTGSGCHDPGTAGGLGFSTQASAFAALSHQVSPGDGVDSDLYVTLDMGVMPEGKPKLSAANIAIVENWIDAGALDN